MFNGDSFGEGIFLGTNPPEYFPPKHFTGINNFKIYFMIKTVFTFLFILQIGFVSGQQIISGSIKLDTSIWVNKVYLLRFNNLNEIFSGSSKYLVDSASIGNKNLFSFSKLYQTGFYRINLVLKNDPPGSIILGELNENFLVLYLTKNSYFHLQGNADALKTSIVNADDVNIDLIKLQKERYTVNTELQPKISKMLSEISSLVSSRDSIRNEIGLLVQKKYLENNVNLRIMLSSISNLPAKLFGLWDIYNNGGMHSDINYIEAELRKFKSKNLYVMGFLRTIEELKYSLIQGTVSPIIILKDTSGTMISIHNLTNSILILDFWASWCKPCLEEMNSTLKELNTRFGKDGLVIVSINFDKDRQRWVKAIKDNNFPWIHLSDLSGKESIIWERYRIRFLPTCYVLDSAKRIISKDLRGKMLIEFVENYLQK